MITKLTRKVSIPPTPEDIDVICVRAQRSSLTLEQFEDMLYYEALSDRRDAELMFALTDAARAD